MDSNYDQWIRQAAHVHKTNEERLIQFARVPEEDRNAYPEVCATTDEQTAMRLLTALRSVKDGYLYRVSATFSHTTFPEMER